MRGSASGYGAASALVDRPGGRHLGLETASALTPTGLVERPVFFRGLLSRPDVAAAGLLAIADIAGSRYVDAGLMQRLANLDPVVTASGDRLRFESFSACNSVHARLDLLPDGLSGGEVGFGTTNVDINQPLRTSLARMTATELLHLTVGPDDMQASTMSEHHSERKVSLPDRWVRGLAEAPSVTAAMSPIVSLAGPQVAQLARQLPRVAGAGPELHLLPPPRGPRLLPRGLPGTVAVPGAARLRGVDRVLRHTRSMSVHRHPDGATAWVLELSGARLTLVLTADPWRGFSGEGGLLELLARPRAEAHGRVLLEVLGWDAVVDPRRLGATAGLGADDVADGLAWLAASGRLGHDLAAGAWFHRELPVDSEKVLRRNPRLRGARELAAGGVRRTSSTTWEVRASKGADHTVTGSPQDSRTCTCAWWVDHAAGRGPCKHVLAVLMLESAAQAEGDPGPGRRDASESAPTDR